MVRISMPPPDTVSGLGRPLLSKDCGSMDAPAGLVRVLLPSEWGVPYPVGVAYVSARDQIALLGRREVQIRGDVSEIVIITPYEDLVGQVRVPFDVDDAINIAFDDAESQLLLLNSTRLEIASVKTDSLGLPLPSSLVRTGIRGLGSVAANGMAVDAERRHLLILDRVQSRIVRVDIDNGFQLVSSINLRELGSAKLRGIAVHPLGGHMYVGDVAQGTLLELSQTGRLLRRYGTAALDLIALGGMSFGPSADLTDDTGIYHLFAADSRLSESGASARGLGLGKINEVAVNPLRNDVCAATINYLPRRR